MSDAPTVDMDQLRESMELQRVNLQFNGDGNLTVTFYVNGRYYEILSASPAFKPIDPSDTISVEPSSSGAIKLLELQNRLAALRALGLREQALAMLASALQRNHSLTDPNHYRQLFITAGPKVADNKSLFDQEKAFAAAWVGLKMIVTY